MGNCPIFQHLSPPFPTQPHHSTHHISQNTPSICSKTQYVVFTATAGCHLWHPPFNSQTFKLTLRADFCVPLHAVHIAPKLPTQGTCGPPPATTSGKNGTGPRLPMRAQKHAAAIWGPSPNTYKYAGQRCVNDVPAGAPPDRPRSVAYDRHACRPAWSIYRHVPRCSCSTRRSAPPASIWVAKEVTQRVGMESHQPTWRP